MEKTESREAPQLVMASRENPWTWLVAIGEWKQIRIILFTWIEVVGDFFLVVGLDELEVVVEIGRVDTTGLENRFYAPENILFLKLFFIRNMLTSALGEGLHGASPGGNFHLVERITYGRSFGEKSR